MARSGCRADREEESEEKFLTEQGRVQLKATLDDLVARWPVDRKQIEAQGWRGGIVTQSLLDGKAPSKKGALVLVIPCACRALCHRCSRVVGLVGVCPQSFTGRSCS